MLNCLIIGAGGALGAMSRYLLSFIQVPLKTNFPVATLLTNLIGAFIIGLVVGLAAQKNILGDRMVLFLKVGICGGFTTFSSFALESTNLFGDGRTLMGLLYVVVSIIGCLLAVMAGKMLIR